MWAKVIPGLTYLTTRSRDAKELMDYYWDTIDQCVDPVQVVEAMSAGGFASARSKLVVPGAFCEYIGKKSD
jgi:demethylmenaquinone methyltransferase/2-methoxy-6-polyprenyl-1,4-benzoquinol methylase